MAKKKARNPYRNALLFIHLGMSFLRDVGLTLTASSNVAFIELAWTYADCCQCEDRAHRIGQKDNVTCYYLLGRGTIDHTIYSLIHRKKSIASEIMNSDDDIPTDEMYFNELVKSFLTASG